MAAKKGRPRTALREAERAADKATEARRRLWALTEGSAPARPIVVSSASIVEPVARALRCLVCENTLDVGAHDAVTVDDVRLRRVEARCRRCGEVRAVYFRIVSTLPS